MKVVQINTCPNGSTGNIMMNIHKELLKKGIVSYIVWGRGRKAENEHEIYMNDKIGVYFHVLYSRVTGKNGFASKRATQKLLKKLDEINPDIIHLHNIHGYYINIELLFNYIKKRNIKVVWTLHDCWAFTGHCSHFSYINCTKWKKECKDCQQKMSYPKSIVDNSKWCYKKKKELFCGVNDLTIVTPSDWLRDLVKKSFLKEYNIKVINNGIDDKVFKPLLKDKLIFRKKYNLQNKKIILGVANVWNNRKGLTDFIELSKVLDDEYKVVLVGLNKKQIKYLPKNILGLARTQQIEELVEIYNSVDIFLNASVEETFGLTTIEALFCKCLTLVYDKTALPEIVDYNRNIIISNYDMKYIKKYIEKTLANKYVFQIDKNKYLLESMQKSYIELYQKICD